MQYPHEIETPPKLRAISTHNVDELAGFQNNKNRRYIQLEAGELKSDYLELNLNGVQLFRETLSIGARIEASPASRYLPFAAILPSSGDYRYCGRECDRSSIMQATGGHWDICFKNSLDYVCTAFDREFLNRQCEQLIDNELPEAWLLSRPSLTNPQALHRFSHGVSRILKTAQTEQEILEKSQAVKMLSAETTKLVLDVMMPTSQLKQSFKKQPQRIRGVRRVMEYLQVHADQLPTIAELCHLAGLSERSLEYGFREYLDTTPIRYLRLVRLNGARTDLLAATDDSVRDIALKWGFVEFGRFAGEYKQLFHELPSHTLRLHTE